MAKKKKSSKKPKGAFIGMGEDLREAVEQRVEEEDTTISALGRRALIGYLEGGKNEPIIMMNLVQMMNTLNRLEGVIPEGEFNSLQKNMSNIMDVKGGM